MDVTASARIGTRLQKDTKGNFGVCFPFEVPSSPCYHASDKLGTFIRSSRSISCLVESIRRAMSRQGEFSLHANHLTKSHRKHSCGRSFALCPNLAVCLADLKIPQSESS